MPVDSSKSATSTGKGPRRKRGEGSVYFDTARQRWAVTLHISDPAPGEPRNKTFRGKTKAEALAKRDAFRDAASVNKTLLRKGRRLRWTVVAVVDRWLESKIKPTFDRHGNRIQGMDTTTYITTEVLVRRYIRPYFGPLNLDVLDLTVGHLEDWHTVMMADLQARGKTACQAKAAHKRLVQALNYACSIEPETGLRYNVARQVSAPRYTAPKVQPLDDGADERLFVAARQAGPGMGLLLLIGFTTGLRKQELAGLQWRDLDLANRQLVVRRKVNRLNKEGLRGHPLAQGKGKTALVVRPGVKMKDENSYRLVPLSPPIIEQLLKYRQWLSDQAKFAGQRWTGQDPLSDAPSGKPHEAAWVFPDEHGEKQCPNALYRAYVKVCRAAGVTTTKVHQMRHEMVSSAIRKGTPLHKVQQLAGHEQLSTTLDIYGHFKPTDLHDVADALGSHYASMGVV